MMDTKKLLELVDNLDFKICFIDKNTHGQVNLETHEIKLNLETMLVEVLVHELIHIIHPMLNKDKDEEIIDELTARTWKKLTSKQIRLIAKKILERRKK